MTLFGDPDPPDDEPADNVPQWHDFANTTRHRCDPCVEVAFLNRRYTIRPAKWRRRVAGLDRYYCAGHAQDVKLTERQT